MARKQNRIVYSSEPESFCRKCGRPTDLCSCGRRKAAKADGVVRISRSTKGRKGSGVSVITGLPLHGKELSKLAKELKKKCGSGGTVKNGVIEIQGEHREKLQKLLTAKGYNVKIAGG